jgi:UDP-N-acetylglucosamine 2-epimerase (non-hydrolysing)
METLMEEDGAYEKMAKAINPYGDGQACERIVEQMTFFIHKE